MPVCTSRLLLSSAVLATWVLLASISIEAQPVVPPGPPAPAILAAARTVIKNARYAALTTIGDDGAPHTRIVDPFPPEDQLTIWVATNSRTRKVGEITRDRRVTLTYFDRDAQHYATIAGVATLVRDLAARAARWKAEWAPFYPNGYRGDDYLLIRIEPIRLEVVAPELGMKNDPTTWRPVVLELRPSSPGQP